MTNGIHCGWDRREGEAELKSEPSLRGRQEKAFRETVLPGGRQVRPRTVCPATLAPPSAGVRNQRASSRNLLQPRTVRTWEETGGSVQLLQSAPHNLVTPQLTST